MAAFLLCQKNPVSFANEACNSSANGSWSKAAWQYSAFCSRYTHTAKSCLKPMTHAVRQHRTAAEGLHLMAKDLQPSTQRTTETWFPHTPKIN